MTTSARFYVTTSTAFAASMCAFLVGGAFIAPANNELTWFTFGGIAALHRQFRAGGRACRSACAPAVRAAPAMPPPRRTAIA